MSEVVIKHTDRERAASYYSSQMFGSDKKTELLNIYTREVGGNVDALVLLFAQHRTEAEDKS